MAVMSAAISSLPASLPRRTFLVASAAGAALLVAGCTSSGDEAPTVTAQQVDQLAGQLAVQEALVAAFATATQADPALGSGIADLTGQVQAQLARLRAAAPGPSGGAAAPSSAAPPAGPDARAWLRTQVATAATSHATACLDQSGARAALLGSIAAGLRGQDGRFA
jgi:hypothetical protein